MDSEQIMRPDIIVVKNNFEARFLQLYWLIIPGVFFARALVEYVDSNTLPFALIDSARILFELGLLLSILCCNLLFAELPHKLHQIFSSSAFLGAKQADFSELLFYQKLTTQLNHPLRLLAGAFTVLMMSIYYGTTLNLQAAISQGIWGFIFQILTAPTMIFYSYFVGILAWKYLVISNAIYRLPRDFKFQVQLGHPDKAGGLLPIGFLGLKLIYVAVIPTGVSAIELLLGYVGWLELSSSNYVFFVVMLVYGLIGSLVGFLPIFKFHRVMLSQRDVGMVMLNQLASRILKLKAGLLAASATPTEGTVETLRSDIAAYESFYHAHQKLNTWPLNRKVLFEIWATQTFVGGQLLATWNLISQFI